MPELVVFVEALVSAALAASTLVSLLTGDSLPESAELDCVCGAAGDTPLAGVTGAACSALDFVALLVAAPDGSDGG